MRKKVTVVGAGNVGATTAQRIFEKGYADVVLVDIVEGLPQGKALDILESGPVVGSDSHIVGTNGYDETYGSDIVVITSGIARKPGMSRDDLLLTNMKIVTNVVEEIIAKSPKCILLPVTNPLDAMAQQAFRVSNSFSSNLILRSLILSCVFIFRRVTNSKNQTRRNPKPKDPAIKTIAGTLIVSSA